ncbi:MAG TPA: hypothetical protein VI702_00070 [Nitrospiria bacterium]
MAEQFGGYLIKCGKITEKQLSVVLERQVTMGGRLGTNLVELGYLTEEDLTQVLSKIYGLPPLEKSAFDQIDPDVIRMIPREIAQKYWVIPFKREKTTLSVALLEPGNLAVLDELRFITGCSSIKPFVVSELRVQFALEKYYQVGRQLRYISVLEEDRKKHAEILDTEPDGIKKDPTPEGIAAALKQAREDWAKVHDRDQAISIFMKASQVVLDRGILFVVRGGALAARNAFPSKIVTGLVGFELKVETAPLIGDVIKAKSLYHGPPPPNQGPYQDLCRVLGGQMAGAIVLCPILINDQAATLFFGDNQVSGREIKDLEFIRTLAQKMGQVLEIMILRKKVTDA